MSGFMGGLRDTDEPPTIPVTATTPGRAVVEGVAVDEHDPNRLCPNYAELRVTPPGTTDTVTVPVDIVTCELQVRPIGSGEPSAAPVAEQGCADLGGIVDADRTCHAHSKTAEYKVGIFPARIHPDSKAVSDFVTADRGYFLDWIARFGHDGPDRQHMYDVHAEDVPVGNNPPPRASVVEDRQRHLGAAHEGHPATVFRSFNSDLTGPSVLSRSTRCSSRTPMWCRCWDRRWPGCTTTPRSSCCHRTSENFALTDDAVIFFFGEGQLIPADNSGPRQPRGAPERTGHR